jgi:hypothetical protein
MLVYVRKKFLSLFARFGEQSGFGAGGFDRLVLAGRRETNSQQILFKARNRLCAGGMWLLLRSRFLAPMLERLWLELEETAFTTVFVGREPRRF